MKGGGIMIHLLLGVIYLAFISLGLPDGLLGAAWPVMYPQLSVPVSCMGVISVIISCGTITSSLLSDRLTRRLGTGKVMVISVAMTALALLGFSVSNSFILLCLLAIPYGLGAGGVDAGLNNYVALHYSSRHMSWLHCMWGVGAAVGPYILGAVLTGGQVWNMGYRYVGLMPDTLHFAVMGLTLHFRNDSILHQCQPLTAHAGKAELVIQSDTLGEIRSVSGFVYLPQSESGALMRINRMKVMRYHAKDSLKLDKDSLNFSTVEKKELIQSVPTSIKESSVDKPNTPTTPQRATDRLRQRHASPAAQKSIAAPQKAAVHTPARRVPQGSRPDTLSSGPKGRRQLMLPPKERQQGTPRKTQRMQQPQKIEME